MVIGRGPASCIGSPLLIADFYRFLDLISVVIYVTNGMEMFFVFPPPFSLVLVYSICDYCKVELNQSPLMLSIFIVVTRELQASRLSMLPPSNNGKPIAMQYKVFSLLTQ